VERFFAVTAPGLKVVAGGEIERLGLLSNKPRAPDEAGGVSFDGGLADLYRANLQLRTPNRILLRLGEFYAAAFSELRKKAGRLEWERCLHPGSPVALRVTTHKSRLYHSDAVAERIAGAIADRLSTPSPVSRFDENEPGNLPQLIVVRLVRDLCTISLDTSGENLHRRGYRLATAKAPLRENLAAGILVASGWDGRAPLIDPFCGSGTIPIEAALLAHNIPPGRNRRFAFMSWPGFDRHLWESLLLECEQDKIEGDYPEIQGSDRDEGAITLAGANAARAGAAGLINFSHRALSSIEPHGRGWVVTNPPYGMRASPNKDLRNLYAQLGNVLRSKCQGWQVAILSSDDHLLNTTGLPFTSKISMNNGGINVRLAMGQVP
jgi:putative N6-adenine-specific DNA methylase